ncbi:MAG: hypothetical protein WC622_03945 [Pedobacter sp.]|jgi:hypothetical protein|uniref:hypothetical protein n=1 Tax=Pedobacter sp. TaxID=1411316 RepID=UPI00356A638B
MLKKENYNLLYILQLLLVPIVYELVMGGGGHYLEIGSLTFRMVSFLVVMSISTIFVFIKGVIRKDIVVIIAILTFLTLFSSVVGFINNAPIGKILEEIKPLIFFYMLLFFSLTIKDINDIRKISTIIKTGAILMALIYITILALLLLGKINFMAFYTKQNAIGEVMFRNELLFFYKGFIYLCIGFFFFLLSDNKYKKLAMILLFFSILLTLTRGFILFTLVITLYYVFFINKKVYAKYLVFFIGIAAMVIVSPYITSSFGDKSKSNAIRYIQIEQVLDSVTPLSFFIGHGLGIGVPIRENGMEISFLEIFHKQGIIGVSCWLAMFFYIFLMYFNIKEKRYRIIALPFLLSVAFVILQSTTNPYMNNPIGLSIILITIVVFSRLLEIQKKNRDDFSVPCNL